MKIAFEKWLDENEIPDEAITLFEESIRCYKISAYRSAFIMSYIAFQNILKTRMIKATNTPTVWDHNTGLAVGYGFKVLEYSVFRFGIKCGRRLVKYDNGGVFEIGAGKRDLLPLSFGKLCSFIGKLASHKGVKSVFKLWLYTASVVNATTKVYRKDIISVRPNIKYTDVNSIYLKPHYRPLAWG